jgi:hypothetical protein
MQNIILFYKCLCFHWPLMLYFYILNLFISLFCLFCFDHLVPLLFSSSFPWAPAPLCSLYSIVLVDWICLIYTHLISSPIHPLLHFSFPSYISPVLLHQFFVYLSLFSASACIGHPQPPSSPDFPLSGTSYFHAGLTLLPWKWSSMFPRNIGEELPDYTASHSTHINF